MTRLSIHATSGWLGPGHLIDDVQIVCEDGMITYAGPITPIEGRDDERLDVDGFLMPAVADRHVHIELSDPAAVLRGGVTAVRDLAWPAARIFPLADLSETPAFDGPLIRAAGPMLTAPGGYPVREAWAPEDTAREVADIDEAIDAVTELAGLGATAIKVSLNSDAGPVLGDAELTTVCDVAHDAGIPVTAHAQGKGQVERGLGAGIDELAHTPWEPLSEDVITRCAQRLRIVSTLDTLSFGKDTPQLRTALDNLTRFHRAGGSVTYGTDLGNGSIPLGVHVGELQLLRAAGLTGEEVLEAATRAPLAPDAPADLIALAADPTSDVRAFGRLVAVIRSGRIVLA